jgi:hypothetical protein
MVICAEVEVDPQPPLDPDQTKTDAMEGMLSFIMQQVEIEWFTALTDYENLLQAAETAFFKQCPSADEIPQDTKEAWVKDFWYQANWSIQ